MRREQVIWYPFWYELDQPVSVGQTADFDFFRKVPDYVKNDGLRVFYHGGWQEDCRRLYDTERWRIVSIEHPILGRIQRIDSNGLDYGFTMVDGRVLRVDAEEKPGLVDELPEPIRDWRVFVEIEAV